MVGIASRRLGGDRIAALNLTHPVRRLFGQSRGVNWGVLFILVVVGLMLVRPLVMSGLSWHRTAALLTERRAEVASLKRTHHSLEEQVAYYRTDAFIGEQARQYGWIEPGEQAFVVRELVHPESAADYAVARLRNATVDGQAALAPAR
jgi:cell division protein FtsB